MFVTIQLVLIWLSLSGGHSNIIWEAPSELHPVHGLYVKPSTDGTTGDLYVAATEDKGIKSKWLTDQPINFLPAASKLKPKSVPASLSSIITKTTLPQEEIITSQKRTVVKSPAVKYAYALPIPGLPGAEGITPHYPYTYPPSPLLEGSLFPSCPADIHTQTYPFPYFYPPMMSTMASALNNFKQNEDNEENNPFISPMPYWPHAYGYPYPYIIYDPSTYARNNASPMTESSSSSNEIS